MGKFSPITASRRLPVDIPLRPYLRDHRFEGRAVYPAVEAMQTLAATVKQCQPDMHVNRMAAVRFDKFLLLPSEATSIPAFVEVSTHDNMDFSAALLTRTRLKNAAMSRIKTHATLSLSKHDDEVAELPPVPAASLQGTCIQISSDRIYDELVPFGRAYRNLCDKLIISPDGALAAIRSPEIEPEGPLGSPFPLDAAFHAACVWAQRYSGVVAFPVGLDHRVVVSPACPGQRYFSRLVPIHTAADILIFDIWIYDSGGRLCELAAGVRMRDVSGGRLQPPGWIRGGKV